MPPLSRRRFLELLAGAAVLGPGVARAAHAAHAAGIARLGGRAPALRIGLVGPMMAPAGSVSADVMRGARLGAEEAHRSAALFGGSVTLVVDASAERLLRDVRPSALLVGDPAMCGSLAERTARENVLLLNVGCASDALRGAACALHVFHVTPSDAMRRDAIAASLPIGGSVQSWHHSLEAFGAAQLNDRFRARYGDAMNAAAWEAWMAVKVVAEAALRTESVEPVAMGAYLVRDQTRFDGHKGRPLSFRAWDHQLRQPLYIVPGSGARPLEVPARTAGMRVADQLDQLGMTASATACRWSAP